MPPPPQRPVLTTNLLLYRHSVWAFGAFSAAVLIAFWPSYFSRLDAQPTFHPHAHGLAMSSWCAMLVAQAWLIRTGRRPLHARVGLLSYVLVPIIAGTTINFVHFRTGGAPQLGAVDLYSLALMVNAVVAFVAVYALAMAYRHQPAVHARYMLCTIFPLFTPVTDRLIGRHIPALVPLVPRIDGVPVLPTAGFLAADVIVAALCVWDWRANRRANVFPVVLAILLVYHASVLTFHRLPFWRAFCEWFVTLPLS